MPDNRIGTARVWILPGNTWSESGWTEERRLIPLSSMSLPSAKGNASFQLLRSLRDDGDGVGMVSDPGMIVPGHWIAVTFGVDVFSFAEVEWWGFIKRSTGVRVEGGDLRGTVEALEVGHLMEDSGVIGWRCRQGTASTYEIEDAPTWNMAHKGGEVVGNIVDVTEDSFTTAVFARALDMVTGGTARVGTRLDLLLHVITYCKPQNLPPVYVTPGTPSVDAAIAILNNASSPEVLDVREATFCGAIDLCATRTRSIAWTIVPENVGWNILLWKEPANNGINIDLDSLDETEVRVDETEEAVDEVVVEGGPIIYCGSVSPQDSNLDPGWTADQETAWKTAVTQNGGENLDDYVERVAQFRSKASLAPVFTRFKVPDTNGDLTRSLDPGDGSTSAKFFPRVEWSGSAVSLSATETVDPYWPTTEILRWIPVQTDGGDTAQQQWAKPRVFRRDAAASAPLDGPVWVDLTADWKKRHGAAIDIGDHGPSISVKFSPPEILAKGHWSTGSPAPAKLDKLGFTTPDNASVPSHARCIDWEQIVATVAIPGGQRLRVPKWREGYSASTARRSLTIRNDKLQLWVLHEGTVLDAGDGATPTKQAAVSFPRNDYPTAERIATEAAAWSFRERSAITIEMPRPDAAPAWASLGYPIADVQDGGTTYHCNTCVGAIAIDWGVKRPRITISTVFPERPAAGSGSASPTGGGSVSSSLGGTVAQSARSSAAAVASIIQAAQQVPLIAPRPRSATDPGPLFWVVSQASHGFTVGQPLKLSGSTYALAKADTEANAQVVAIVGAVISTGVFVAVRAGPIAGLSGKTAGARYFLDAATAGAVTTTAPAIKVPLYDATSSTEAIAVIGNSGGEAYTLPGTEWVRLTSSPYTLTGTKKIRRFMVVGAGGGAGGPCSTTKILGYVAATAGGSPATSLEVVSQGGGGGAGGAVIADIDCTGLTTVTFSIGAAGTKGAADASGNAGGNTTLTAGSLALTAYGGAGGNAGTANQDGAAGAGGDGGAVNVGAVIAKLRGATGRPGGVCVVTSAGGLVWATLDNVYAAAPVSGPGTAFGNGGGPTLDGLQGAVFIAI